MKSMIAYKEIGEYIVYRNGTVFSKKRGIFLTPLLGKGRSKYYSVKIPKRILLHRLVAQLFLPNPDNLPEVNHLDGNKLNNNDWNLKWCTRLENMTHAYATGLKNNSGENSGRAKLEAVHVKIIRECIELKFKREDISKYFGVSKHQIYCIKTGRSWASR